MASPILRLSPVSAGAPAITALSICLLKLIALIEHVLPQTLVLLYLRTCSFIP